MEPNSAAEHLQTIRTLMERATLYRRALAPIMIFAGTLGLVAAAAGLLLHVESMRAFETLWLGTAIASVLGAFLIARRQALKDKEAFWSPPTRRVAQALIPPLAAGLSLGSFTLIVQPDGPSHACLIPTLIWILFYGCALHSAGFFMPRGIKIFGWLFIASSIGLFYLLAFEIVKYDFSAHWLMGFFFGGLHLAYGAYLYLTDKQNPVA